MHPRHPASARPRAAARTVAALALVLASGCQRPPDPAPDVGVEAGSVLRRGLGADPETLAPQLASDNASLAVLADLHEGLVAEDAGGRLVPGAAESWSIEDDGRTYVFRLRPDLRWSNGEPLTAAHFAEALRTIRAPASVAPMGDLFEPVVAVDAPDPRTLRLRLARPLAHLPALLALPAAAPWYPGTADPVKAPSSGPYRLDRWTPGERIELVRNPHYRDAGTVHIDRVVYLPVADLATELRLFRTGELDLTSEVPNSQLDWIRTNLPDQLRVLPFLGTYAYAVNVRRLGDPGARQALSMTVDRERITTQVTGAGETPALGWVPPGLPGYAPAVPAWAGWTTERRLGHARKLWADAGTRGAAPRVLLLCTDASANHRRTAVALADLWREALGVDVRIEEFEWGVYLAMRRNPGRCDLVRFGWSADFVDVEAFAQVFETGHPQNTLGYSSRRYDEALARARRAGTEALRLAGHSEAEAVLLDEVPVIPVFFRVTKRLVSPRVSGVEPNPLGHLPTRHLALEP